MKERIHTGMLLEFLRQVDPFFPIPLSQKQDLAIYAEKLMAHGTLCGTVSGEGKILALAAGYTDNTPEKLGYLSMVATAAEARGQGLAAGAVTEFLEIARSKGLCGVHLYAVASNTQAVRMYQKLGFVEYHPADEPHPDDLHLIYFFRR